MVWLIPRMTDSFQLQEHHREVPSLEASSDKLRSADTVERGEFEQALRAKPQRMAGELTWPRSPDPVKSTSFILLVSLQRLRRRNPSNSLKEQCLTIWSLRSCDRSKPHGNHGLAGLAAIAYNPPMKSPDALQAQLERARRIDRGFRASLVVHRPGGRQAREAVERALKALGEGIGRWLRDVNAGLVVGRRACLANGASPRSKSSLQSPTQRERGRDG